MGAKPFAALSFIYKRFSPHINLGYQWNGDSLLSGDVGTGRKEDLPDQLLYVAGIDIGSGHRRFNARRAGCLATYFRRL